MGKIGVKHGQGAESDVLSAIPKRMIGVAQDSKALVLKTEQNTTLKIPSIDYMANQSNNIALQSGVQWEGSASNVRDALNELNDKIISSGIFQTGWITVVENLSVLDTDKVVIIDSISENDACLFEIAVKNSLGNYIGSAIVSLSGLSGGNGSSIILNKTYDSVADWFQGFDLMFGSDGSQTTNFAIKSNHTGVYSYYIKIISSVNQVPLGGFIDPSTAYSNIPYIGTDLSGYQLLSEKGQANGYAPLNSSSKIDSAFLPSYVDDVIEVANYSSLPSVGETGKIYITLDTNFEYRWSGSTYIKLSDDTAIWGHIGGTLSDQTDLQALLTALQNDINTRISFTTNQSLTNTQRDTARKNVGAQGVKYDYAETNLTLNPSKWYEIFTTSAGSGNSSQISVQMGTDIATNTQVNYDFMVNFALSNGVWSANISCLGYSGNLITQAIPSIFKLVSDGINAKILYKPSTPMTYLKSLRLESMFDDYNAEQYQFTPVLSTEFTASGYTDLAQITAQQIKNLNLIDSVGDTTFIKSNVSGGVASFAIQNSVAEAFVGIQNHTGYGSLGGTTIASGSGTATYLDSGVLKSIAFASANFNVSFAIGTYSYAQVFFNPTTNLVDVKNGSLTQAQRDSGYIPIFTYTSNNGTSVTGAVYNTKFCNWSTDELMRELFNELGTPKNGLFLSAGTTAQNLAISSGKFIGMGVNRTAGESRISKAVSGSTAVTLYMVTSSTIELTPLTNLTTTFYNPSGSTKTAVDNNKWTNLRVYAVNDESSPNGILVVVQYGPAQYTSKDLAIAGFSSEAFTPNPNVEALYYLGFVTIEKNGLSANASFSSSTKWQDGGVSSNSNSATTTYYEFTTTTTSGDVTITHNLNKQYPVISILDTTTNANVSTNITYTSLTQATINFPVPYAVGQYIIRAVI